VISPIHLPAFLSILLPTLFASLSKKKAEPSTVGNTYFGNDLRRRREEIDKVKQRRKKTNARMDCSVDHHCGGCRLEPARIL
jgi:hypothetical protein